METKALLTKIVSINSVTQNESQLGFFIQKIFNQPGIKISTQKISDNRFNILAEKGQGKNSVLLYSHLDTINVVDGWKTNPFKLTIQGDKAYGLGAWDMKGGMVSLINCFLNYQPGNLKLKMAFCVDEENISQGGYQLMESDFIEDVTCVISTEPAFKHGLQGIVTGRIGRAVYRATISGRARHLAFYHHDYDINQATAEFIRGLRKYEKNKGDKKQFIFARNILSKAEGMSMPAKTELELDCAILSPETQTSLFNFLKTLACQTENKYKEIKICVNAIKRSTPFLEPYIINKNNQHLKKLSQSVQSVTKKPSTPYFRSSVADENIFGSQNITVLGIGPVGENAHTANEWVSLKSLYTLSDIISHFLSTA